MKSSLILVFSLLPFGAWGPVPTGLAAPATGDWDLTAAILRRVIPPTVPERDFSITAFGAGPDRCLPVVLTRFEGTMLRGHSPRIYVRGATNVANTGRGPIDANARETLSFMKDCTVESVNSALYFKGNVGRGGAVEINGQPIRLPSTP